MSLTLIAVPNHMSAQSWLDHMKDKIKWYSPPNLTGQFYNDGDFLVVKTDNPEWLRRLAGITFSSWVEWQEPKITKEDRTRLYAMSRMK